MSNLIATKNVGCHKCGQRGHWARDCTNTPAAGVAEQHATGQGNNAALDVVTGGQESAVPSQDNTGLLTVRKRTPRQKLTLPLLQESKGMPDLEMNFYAAMKSVFRGKGHERSNTRRLLELYKRWSDRVLPLAGPNDTFDSFIADIEKLSSTSEVKHMMNNKRMEMLEAAVDANKFEPQKPEELPDHREEEELMELAMTGDISRDAGGDNFVENEDEEMLQFIECGTNNQTNDEPLELQDDELLDLLFEH